MTCSKKFMRNYKGFDAVDVHLADDGIVQAIGSGDIVMSMKTPQGMKKGVLTNVWHIPKLSRNLFSVGRFTKDVGPVTFTKDGCYGEAKGTKWKIGAREGKGLFKLQNDSSGAGTSKCSQVVGMSRGHQVVPLAPSAWPHRSRWTQLHRDEEHWNWHRHIFGEEVGRV
uniref:Retrovirus-related Pol polyprotein from transposon TNT 1-94-like beta-barrel domain-containing protein n=1 Tax=Peronospora matthiolae TaxID=2874970 RepID=A0AAV1TKL0_9STRA